MISKKLKITFSARPVSYLLHVYSAVDAPSVAPLFSVSINSFVSNCNLCREKDIETGKFLEAANSCLEICHSYGVPLLINDRIDVALACGADGVHIGQSDMPASVARTLLGPEKIIGVSCKTPEQAQQAWADGANYIGCGGVYPTNTKANNPAVGLGGLRAVCMASKLPVVAIGGIGISNADEVMRLDLENLKGVAVVSALFDRKCVLSGTKDLHAVLKRYKVKENV